MSYMLNATEADSYPHTHDNQSFDHHLGSGQFVDGGYITDDLFNKSSANRMKGHNLIRTLRDTNSNTLNHQASETMYGMCKLLSPDGRPDLIRRGKTPNAKNNVQIEFKRCLNTNQIKSSGRTSTAVVGKLKKSHSCYKN
jgi:hypothetical protein